MTVAAGPGSTTFAAQERAAGLKFSVLPWTAYQGLIFTRAITSLVCATISPG